MFVSTARKGLFNSAMRQAHTTGTNRQDFCKRLAGSTDDRIMPLDFRDDARDLYRMVLVILRTGLFTGHMFRILVILVTNIFPNLLTWGEISHLLYFPGPRKGSGVFVGSLKFEVP